MSHPTRDDLVLHRYGEAEAPEGTGEHLARCASCRQEYDAIRSTLAAMDDYAVPEPDAGFEERILRGMSPLVRKASWMPGRRWAVAAALLIMLGAGYLAGRYRRSEGPAPLAISHASRERILMMALGEHLECSERMLVELMNTGGDGSADTAGGLIADNRLYRLTAAELGRPDHVALLEELERVLLDVAHASNGIAHAERADIRQRIENSGLLLKLRIVSTQLEKQRSNEMKPAPERT
jgi:hypothetical protein